MGFGQGALEGLAMSEFWQDRPTLVTGASGLLGGWMVRRLLELGADVICISRDWVPQSALYGDEILPRVKLIRGDIRDAALMERAVAEYEVATVFHLAAQTTVGVANRSPLATFETNVQGTWNVLEACRRSSLVKQILLASSDKAYGAHEVLPYHEDTTPLQGKHPYDVSKSCADLIAQTYAATYGLPVCVTRCGNLFGGGDLNWNRIVPGTIRSVERGQRPIIRSDGNYIRDYLYVEDGVAAYILLAEQMAARPELAGQAFNFSNEVQATVLELVQRILRLMETDLEPEVRNEASNEIRYQYLSAAKARADLGWAPQFSLDEGLGRAIGWYQKFLSHDR